MNFFKSTIHNILVLSIYGIGLICVCAVIITLKPDVKYFLGALSFPQDQSWVSLTPGLDTGIKFGTEADEIAPLDLCYANGMWIAVGDEGWASYSTDGMNWTAYPKGFNAGIKFGGAPGDSYTVAYSVAYGNRMWMIVGLPGMASYSTDGINWTSLPAGDDTGIKFGNADGANSVAYGGGKWVVVGDRGKASYSTDGINWTSLPAGDNTGIKFGTGIDSVASAVTYGNGMWVVVGSPGKASYSTDGINWTAIENTGINLFSGWAVTYDNGMWIAGGGSGKGAYSYNGTDWTPLPSGDNTGFRFGPANGLGNAVSDIKYANGLWIAVGWSGKMSYSSDGINWTAVAPSTTSGARFGTHNIDSLFYGNGVWVIGGDIGMASYYVVPVNSAPSFNNGPMDSASLLTNSTNVGSNIVFTATATDAESDEYFLAICKTNSITANNSSAPTCGGGSWCISGSTVSGQEANCSYSALQSDTNINDWYAFVCDNNSLSSCSSASQGSGDNGSPFYITHGTSTAQGAGMSYVTENEILKISIIETTTQINQNPVKIQNNEPKEVLVETNIVDNKKSNIEDNIAKVLSSAGNILQENVVNKSVQASREVVGFLGDLFLFIQNLTGFISKTNN